MAIPTRISFSSLVLSGHLSCCSAVGQQQSLVAPNAPGGNGHITVAQSTKHFRLLGAGYNPEHAPGAVEDGIGQRHPPPALVESSQRNIRLVRAEYRIARYQGSGVAVGT